MDKNPELFIQKGHPVEWFQLSSELFNSAEILYEHKDFSFVSSPHYEGLKPLVSNSYFLLVGFALENCLKGLAVAENPEFLKPNGTLDKKISSGHNLNNILNYISSVDFSEKEIQVLGIFSDAIPYWGRYPLPKNFNDLKIERFLTEEIHMQSKNIYSKTRKMIYKLTSNGWVDSFGNKINGWETNEFD